MIRYLACNLRRQQKCFLDKSFFLQKRYLSDDSQLIMGGGLEKPQGGLKEEKYFSNQNYDLISRIREQGTKLKCEDCLDDWKEYEKVLTPTDIPTSLRETCCLNKHKNCLEEAFFLNEQTECCTKLLKENKFIIETNINESQET